MILLSNCRRIQSHVHIWSNIQDTNFIIHDEFEFEIEWLGFNFTVIAFVANLYLNRIIYLFLSELNWSIFYYVN